MLETDKHDRHGHDRHDRHGHDSRSSIDIDAVIGSTSPSRGREKPKLNRPSGALEKAGFKPGDKVQIDVSDGEIRIIRAVRIDDPEIED